MDRPRICHEIHLRNSLGGVDEVCIHQKHLPEKSLQVARMAKIYAKARRVIVWLGEDDGASPCQIHIALLASQMMRDTRRALTWRRIGSALEMM